MTISILLYSQGFKEAQTAPQQFSPTRALVGILKESNSTLPIQCIIDWARSEYRNDICELMENFIESTIRQQVPMTTVTESTLNDLDVSLALVLTPNSATTSPKNLQLEEYKVSRYVPSSPNFQATRDFQPQNAPSHHMASTIQVKTDHRESLKASESEDIILQQTRTSHYLPIATPTIQENRQSEASESVDCPPSIDLPSIPVTAPVSKNHKQNQDERLNHLRREVINA